MSIARHRRGMTLVEVVVALAVLSLIVLTLGASLRSMAGSALRIDQRMDAVDEMRVAVAFLGDVLARASVIQAGGAERRLLFDARADSVAWVAIMPARFGAAGRHAFRLSVEPADDGKDALVLRYAPWSGERAAFPDWATAEHRVLVQQVESLVIGYEGEGLAQAWPANWTRRDRLPSRLRLDVATAANAWPPVVLPMRVLASPGMGGFVIGGSTR